MEHLLKKCILEAVSYNWTSQMEPRLKLGSLCGGVNELINLGDLVTLGGATVSVDYYTCIRPKLVDCTEDECAPLTCCSSIKPVTGHIVLAAPYDVAARMTMRYLHGVLLDVGHVSSES